MYRVYFAEFIDVSFDEFDEEDFWDWVFSENIIVKNTGEDEHGLYFEFENEDSAILAKLQFI